MNEPHQPADRRPPPPDHLARWAIKARQHHEREAAQLRRSLQIRPGPYRTAQLGMITAHERAAAVFAGTAAGQLQPPVRPAGTDGELEAEARMTSTARHVLTPLLDYCRGRLPAEAEVALVVGLPIDTALQLAVISTDRDALAPRLLEWATTTMRNAEEAQG